MLEKSEIERLTQIPIDGVARRLGLALRHGVCPCPFHHERNASFTLSRKGNYMKCFGCSVKADPIDLVRQVLGLDFMQACRWLAANEGLVLTDHRPEAKPEPEPTFDAHRYERFFAHPRIIQPAQQFFDQRGITPQVVRFYRLTSWVDSEHVPWLQIPYYDADGRTLIGVQQRNLDPTGAGSHRPRFRFAPGCHASIYGLPVLRYLGVGDVLTLVEGPSDLWAAASAASSAGAKGMKALAIPSASMLTPSAAKVLAALGELRITIRMIADQDAPGHQLLEQVRQILPQVEEVTLPPGYKDFGQWFAATRQAL